MKYKSSDSGNYALHKSEFISTASFPGNLTDEAAERLYPVSGSLEISEFRRFGLYLSFLRLMRLRGRTDLSVDSIAAETGIRGNQVEEDLMGHGLILAGQKAVHISSLMAVLEQMLGYCNETESFLAGAGKLGTSLLLKENLGQTSLKIVAAFDTDYRKIGSLIGSIRVMSPDKIIPLAARMHVSLGIIATPAGEASHVADLLAGAGMKAIWNFTAENIDPGPGIIVEQTRPGQDIAAAYERIIHRLRSQAVH